MIEVEQLSKTYGRFRAIQNVTFSAEKGQIVGFLGANGAGKTTTMRILAGYLPPTGGRASVAGYDVFEESMAVRQHVGYLPETVPLYRDMTVHAYLCYLAEIRRLPERHERADAILERVGLSERAHHRIRTLSKGMRQRVGLASVLLHAPPVLILDEPTIGLDPLQVLELRDIVRSLRHDHTVLFSTHILSEAEQMCDDIIILNRGEVLTQGTPAELRQTLQRGGRLLIRLAGDAVMRAQASALLAQLPNVHEVQADDDALVITPNIEAENADADSFGAQVAQTLINAQYPVIEMRPVAMTLEDIFIEFVRR